MVSDAQTGPRGRRVALATVGTLVLLLFVVPLPHHTQVEGVVWLPESAQLRAGTSGFIKSVRVAAGAQVAGGTAIVSLEDPLLAARVRRQLARVEMAQARYDAESIDNPARAQQLATELTREQAELHALQERASRLEVRAVDAGRLWLPDSDDLRGRHVKQGEVLGYVIPAAAPLVRVIVAQTDADFIRTRTRSVAVKLPFDPGSTWAARVIRAVPAASNELPSAALGREGGGAVATDPRDQSGRKSLMTHFQYELALPAQFPYRFIGSRASVRFEHPPEPLGFAMWRGLRRLFLAYFHS